MKTIEYKHLNSLYAWMDFIVNEKDILLAGEDCHLKIFGEDDSAYLLINAYDSDSSAVEYYLKAADGVNGVFGLISLLAQFHFSVNALLEALPALNYSDTQSGYCAVLGDMQIFRESVKSN